VLSQLSVCYDEESRRTADSSGLALLLRIRELPGSNLGPETGYPD
jgi:hypothetical protein